RAGLDRSVVFGRLQVDRIGRARHRTQPARHALLEAILVAHQHLLAAPLREHRHLLFGVVDGDRLAEEVLEGGGEPDHERTNHSHCLSVYLSGKGLKRSPTVYIERWTAV